MDILQQFQLPPQLENVGTGLAVAPPHISRMLLLSHFHCNCRSRGHVTGTFFKNNREGIYITGFAKGDHIFGNFHTFPQLIMRTKMFLSGL